MLWNTAFIVLIVNSLASCFNEATAKCCGIHATQFAMNVFKRLRFNEATAKCCGIQQLRSGHKCLYQSLQ